MLREREINDVQGLRRSEGPFVTTSYKPGPHYYYCCVFERRRRRATSNYRSDFGAWYFARLYSSEKSAIF